MVKEDLLLWPQNLLSIEHHQSIRSDNDTNFAYVWIPDVVLNCHDISQWDDNPHPSLVCTLLHSLSFSFLVAPRVRLMTALLNMCPRSQLLTDIFYNFRT